MRVDAGQMFLHFRSGGIEKGRLFLQIITTVLLRHRNKAIPALTITSTLYIQQISNINLNKCKCLNIDKFVKGAFVEDV